MVFEPDAGSPGKDPLYWIGGERNNGGDSYRGEDRMACVIAIMLHSPTDKRLILFKEC